MDSNRRTIEPAVKQIDYSYAIVLSIDYSLGILLSKITMVVYHSFLYFLLTSKKCAAHTLTHAAHHVRAQNP